MVSLPLGLVPVTLYREGSILKPPVRCLGLGVPENEIHFSEQPEGLWGGIVLEQSEEDLKLLPTREPAATREPAETSSLTGSRTARLAAQLTGLLGSRSQYKDCGHEEQKELTFQHLGYGGLLLVSKTM